MNFLPAVAVIEPLVTLADNIDIAVIVPCHNEERPIAHVIQDFRKALPGARIYVYDNNSTDATVAVANTAGATVRSERFQGKGNVVRRMFADIEADIYVLVDGDNTYEAAAAPRMIRRLIDEGLDMVTGVRVANSCEAFRRGHRFGNRLLTGLVARIFGRCTRDMLSGYRVFTRRFVKSFPALSRGFEIETELTVHALELRMQFGEEDTVYEERLPGSASKLNSIRDGFRILRMIVGLLKEERPLPLFGGLAAFTGLCGLGLFAPILSEYLATGLVPRFPTLIASSAMFVVAALLLLIGVVLDSVTHGRREMKRLFYLGLPALMAKLEQ